MGSVARFYPFRILKMRKCQIMKMEHAYSISRQLLFGTSSRKQSSRMPKSLFYRMMASLSDQKKSLIAFDFDHSLVDNNCDLHVIKLAPEGKVPPEIKKLYTDNGWTNYMSEIFRYFHDNGITRENILDCLLDVELTNGMEQLLSFTSKGNKFDHIIISDSNSVFISHVLKYRNISSVFLRVFTNPASFMENGLLTLKGYHHQDWCSLSTDNMCKGHILNTFLEDQRKESVTYSHIYFVGDGFHDLCPGLTLRSEDFLLPRVDFRLNSVVNAISEKDKPVPKSSLKAHVVPWKSGLDILKCLQSP